MVLTTEGVYRAACAFCWNRHMIIELLHTTPLDAIEKEKVVATLDQLNSFLWRRRLSRGRLVDV
jgi:hypothetical protein